MTICDKCKKLRLVLHDVYKRVNHPLSRMTPEDIKRIEGVLKDENKN